MKDEVIDTKWKNRIQGYVYQSKALELKKSTILLSCLSEHLGCAGIARQLHPLKSSVLMKDKVIKTKRYNTM